MVNLSYRVLLDTNEGFEAALYAGDTELCVIDAAEACFLREEGIDLNNGAEVISYYIQTGALAEYAGCCAFGQIGAA